MAKLIAVPQLVENLLLFQIGGNLFLLDTGSFSLQLNNIRAALLGCLFRSGAASFQLQLGLADLVDLSAD